MVAPIGLLLLALACRSGPSQPVAAPKPKAAAPDPHPRKLRDSTAPVPAFEPKQTGSGSLAAVRNAWRDLLGAGCDLDRVRIWTIVEARVLAATPAAMGGQRFEDPDLTALFSADGGWYAPTKDQADLRQDEQDCVARLQAREAELRRIHPLPPAAEARLVRDIGAFAAFWMWGSAADRDPYDGVAIQKNDAGGWSWWAQAPGCLGDRCRQYLIRCPEIGPCRWGASTDQL